jgi:hypothetical protein
MTVVSHALPGVAVLLSSDGSENADTGHSPFTTSRVEGTAPSYASQYQTSLFDIPDMDIDSLRETAPQTLKA